MPILDEIKQMQQQGMADTDIIQRLSEQGYSPKDIDDATNQSRVKAAIYEETGQEAVTNNSSGEMQPSMMNPVQQQAPQEQAYVQQTYPQYAPYSQEYDVYQPPSPGISTETMTEITEQIVTEKLAEIRKNIGNIIEFKTLTEARVAGIDERLRKIESIINQLQASILGKIGSHFQEIQDIKQELGGMQESFSKVVNPLVDKARGERVAKKKHLKEEPEPKVQEETQSPSEQPETEETSEEESGRGKGDGFENYLR